jgi:hypothetical protein
MRKASWILLTVVGLLGVAGSLLSVSTAYFRADREAITHRSLPRLGLEPEVRTAILARRGTAAAYALAFFTLFLTIVLVPYRRGDVWAWYALLAGLVVLTIVAALRHPTLGTTEGIGTPALLLAVGGVALLVDVKRLKKS